MYRRTMEEELRSAAGEYLVVTLTGPRQAGKTTLVQSVFPDKPYVNFELLHNRDLALDDPVAFLEQYPEGAIFDEIQRAPHLLSYIQVRVDESEKKGEFILTGSHQVALHAAISQSLAGRTSILRLLPMSLLELDEAGIKKGVDETLYKGGYPRIHLDEMNPTKSYGNYLRTYIERDVRQLIEVHNLSQFEKFMTLCAARVGQILNKESLAGEVGVSAPTIESWFSILEACYVVFRLPPYFENFGKRVIKSPKIYFCDVGLVVYLLGIEDVQQLSRDPLRGGLFENLVVLELMKARLNQGLDPRLYFYQVTGRSEVDIIYQRGHELVPIEIKSSKTYNSSFLKGIKTFRSLAKERCKSSFLIYSGDEEQMVEGVQLVNYRNAAKILA